MRYLIGAKTAKYNESGRVVAHQVSMTQGVSGDSPMDAKWNALRNWERLGYRDVRLDDLVVLRARGE